MLLVLGFAFVFLGLIAFFLCFGEGGQSGCVCVL